jgi:Zn-dependent metalloprotease
MRYSHITPCHPVQCIVPPHILDAIKLRGNAEQKQAAIELENNADQFRQARQAAEPATSYLAAPVVAPGTPPHLNREVYDAQNGFTLPGTLVRREGDPPSKDQQVNEAYDGAGDTYNLYFNAFNRNSLNGQGMTLI